MIIDIFVFSIFGGPFTSGCTTCVILRKKRNVVSNTGIEYYCFWPIGQKVRGNPKKKCLNVSLAQGSKRKESFLQISSCLLLSPISMSLQCISIDGNVASTAYDFQLAESLILLSFCTVNHIYNQFGVCNTTVTVKISTGELFTCAIKLRILDMIPLVHPGPSI